MHFKLALERNNCRTVHLFVSSCFWFFFLFINFFFQKSYQFKLSQTVRLRKRTPLKDFGCFLFCTKCGLPFLWLTRRAALWPQEQQEQLEGLHQEDRLRGQLVWPAWWADAVHLAGTSAVGRHQQVMPWVKPRRERWLVLYCVHANRTINHTTASPIGNRLLCKAGNTILFWHKYTF